MSRSCLASSEGHATQRDDGGYIRSGISNRSHETLLSTLRKMLKTKSYLPNELTDQDFDSKFWEEMASFMSKPRCMIWVPHYSTP